MAVPTLSANTPVTGQIQWTAFSIQYAGVTYSVPSYQTDKKYTWWAYNAGSPVLNFADILPALAPDDLLLFLNKNGIPINVQFANVLDGDLIVDGSILAKAIGANQITAEKLDTKVLSSGFVLTGKLQVGTHTWTPSEGLIIPGVAVLPGGPTQQSVYITGSPTGGTFTLNGNGLTSPQIAYNAGATTITQTITITGAPTGGTFTLSGNGATTAAIAYNASTATVQTAVRTLGGAWATATVAGSAGAWVITPSAATDPLVAVSSLTGGTTPAVFPVLNGVQAAIRTLGGTWTNATVTGSGTAGAPWVAVATGGTTPLTFGSSLTGGTSPTLVVTQGQIDAQLTANVVAKSLTVQQNLELYGTTNFIRGTVNLASGVTRPTTAPTVYQSWPLVGSHGMPFGATDHGLTNHISDSSILLTATAFFGGNIVGIRKDNGQYQAVTTSSAISGWAANFNPVGGITTIGSNYFVLGYHTNGQHYIYKLDSSFQFVASYDISSIIPPAAGRYCIGRDDAGNVMVSMTYPGASAVRVLFWNTSLGYIGYRDYTTFTYVGTQNINFCGEGNYDFGALRDVICIQDVANFVCDTSGNRLGDAYAFSPSNGGSVQGMWWDGTRFWSMTADGSLYKHGRNITPQTITVSHSWADRNTTGLTHETEETTAPASFVQSARTWINVTTPPPPDAGSSNTDAATRVGIYAAAGAGSRVLQTQVGPAGTDAGYLLDPGVGNQPSCTWEVLTTGTAAPKVSNGFVGVVGTGGGILKSQGATTGQGIILNGDGSFQLGRLNGAANGAMSGAGMDSWYDSASTGSNMNVTFTVTDVPGLSRTITVPAGGGDYLIRFAGWMIPTAGHTVIVAAYIDGVVAPGMGAVGSAGTNGTVCGEWKATLSAGSHTIKMRAYTAASGQTGVLAAGPNSQMIIERKA